MYGRSGWLAAHGVEGIDAVEDVDLVPAPAEARASRSTYAASPPKLWAPKNVVTIANFNGDLPVPSTPTSVAVSLTASLEKGQGS